MFAWPQVCLLVRALGFHSLNDVLDPVPQQFTRRRRCLGSLSKPRRRRQRERHQTKGLMSRTIAMHVRYNSLYISLPSSAKQQRRMTKFCGVYETLRTPANFSRLS